MALVATTRSVRGYADGYRVPALSRDEKIAVLSVRLFAQAYALIDAGYTEKGKFMMKTALSTMSTISDSFELPQQRKLGWDARTVDVDNETKMYVSTSGWTDWSLEDVKQGLQAGYEKVSNLVSAVEDTSSEPQINSLLSEACTRNGFGSNCEIMGEATGPFINYIDFAVFTFMIATYCWKSFQSNPMTRSGEVETALETAETVRSRIRIKKVIRITATIAAIYAALSFLPYLKQTSFFIKDAEEYTARPNDLSVLKNTDYGGSDELANNAAVILRYRATRPSPEGILAVKESALWLWDWFYKNDAAQMARCTALAQVAGSVFGTLVPGGSLLAPVIGGGLFATRQTLAIDSRLRTFKTGLEKDGLNRKVDSFFDAVEVSSFFAVFCMLLVGNKQSRKIVTFVIRWISIANIFYYSIESALRPSQYEELISACYFFCLGQLTFSSMWNFVSKNFNPNSTEASVKKGILDIYERSTDYFNDNGYFLSLRLSAFVFPKNAVLSSSALIKAGCDGASTILACSLIAFLRANDVRRPTFAPFYAYFLGEFISRACDAIDVGSVWAMANDFFTNARGADKHFLVVKYTGVQLIKTKDIDGAISDFLKTDVMQILEKREQPDVNKQKQAFADLLVKFIGVKGITISTFSSSDKPNVLKLKDFLQYYTLKEHLRANLSNFENYLSRDKTIRIALMYKDVVYKASDQNVTAQKKWTENFKQWHRVAAKTIAVEKSSEISARFSAYSAELIRLMKNDEELERNNKVIKGGRSGE